MPFLTVYINFKERVAELAGPVFELLSVKIYLGVLLFLNSFVWLAVYYIAGQVTQELVVLHYNVDFGVDLVGNVNNMYMIPAVGLLIAAANFLLVFFFSRHGDLPLIAHFLLGTAVVVNFFLLISLIPIYFINFS
jgi:hypothetical protein